MNFTRPEGVYAESSPTPRTNLLLNSERIDLWTDHNTPVITHPGTEPYLTRIEDNNAGDTEGKYQPVTVPADNAVYTYSACLKPGTLNNALLFIYFAGGSVFAASFDLTNGAGTVYAGYTPIAMGSEPGPDGTLRAWIAVQNSGQTVAYFYIFPGTGAAAEQGTIEAGRAQLEVGSTLTDFILTTSGVVTSEGVLTERPDGALGAIADFYETVIGPTSPVSIVAIKMDFCGRVFGTSPCLATGEKCFNTYPTCKYKSAYLNAGKVYEFSSLDVRAVRDGVRPYVVSVKLLPTEIKTSFTISGRVNVEMADEPDGDVGIDPYVTTRDLFPEIPGTFWKKFLARNRNYKGRFVNVYEGQFNPETLQATKRWTGKIDNISVSGSRVKIEAVDLLKDLSKIDIPAKIDIKLNSDIDATMDAFTVTDATALADSGAVIIGDEIITYAAKDVATGILSGCVRGAHGTTTAAATAKTKVGLVKIYSAMNAFDRMKSMLLDDAEIDLEYVESSAFDTARDFFDSDDLTVEAVIVEPTKLSTLFFELVDLFECKAWVAENLKITIGRNIPNDPMRPVIPLSDAENIALGSTSSDMNEKSRITRCYLYWSQKVGFKHGDPPSYDRVDVAIDAEAESAAEYAETIPHTIFCRWITHRGFVEEIVQGFARRIAMRKVWRYRDALPLLNVEVAAKDEEMKTGEFLSVTSDEFVDRFGQDIAGRQFQIVKRDRKGTKIALSLQQVGPHSIGYIHATANPNVWADATAEEKKYAYICAADGTLPTDQEGYFIY